VRVKREEAEEGGESEANMEDEAQALEVDGAGVPRLEAKVEEDVASLKKDEGADAASVTARALRIAYEQVLVNSLRAPAAARSRKRARIVPPVSLPTLKSEAEVESGTSGALAPYSEPILPSAGAPAAPVDPLLPAALRVQPLLSQPRYAKTGFETATALKQGKDEDEGRKRLLGDHSEPLGAIDASPAPTRTPSTGATMQADAFGVMDMSLLQQADPAASHPALLEAELHVVRSNREVESEYDEPPSLNV
jgi:hypothetical protein